MPACPAEPNTRQPPAHVSHAVDGRPRGGTRAELLRWWARYTAAQLLPAVHVATELVWRLVA
ncbi:MAG: hypothetical protein ACXU86_19350 [Archangium sp.]